MFIISLLLGRITTSELPAHSHHYSGTTSTDGAHNHVIYENDDPSGGGDAIDAESDSWSANNHPHNTSWNGAHNHTYSGDTDNTGGGASHNNLQPYEVVYRWKRVA
jgi:microcystin-dependent protein